MIARSRKRSLAESLGFQRWVVAVGVLPVGFVLSLAVLSDASGTLIMPGLGTAFSLTAIAAIAAFLIYAAGNWPPTRNNRRSGSRQTVLMDTAKKILRRRKANSRNRMQWQRTCW